MNIEMNSYMVYLVKNEWIYDFLMKLFSSRIFREIAAFLQKKRLRTIYIQTGNGYWVRLAIFQWIHHGHFFK